MDEEVQDIVLSISTYQAYGLPNRHAGEERHRVEAIRSWEPACIAGIIMALGHYSEVLQH
jgi:hypothetical protein